MRLSIAVGWPGSIPHWLRCLEFLTRYEASAVNDTFSSWKGFLATIRATFSTQYKDDEALAMLKEKVKPVHAHNLLVQISFNW